jgi:uncharacterized membrane protein YagU involved in acid resistance
MSTRLKQKQNRRSEDREGDVLKGLAAGVVAGLVASWTMNQFQALLSRLAAGYERSHGAQSLQQGLPEHGIGRELQEQGVDEPQDTAPARLAQAISVNLFNRELTESEKESAGTVFHYVMGTTSGALYGAVAELIPEVKAGAGFPFGAFVWLAVDEGLVPAAGLSKSPMDYPLSVHAYALASHMVYGVTTELVRRAVRNAL